MNIKNRALFIKKLIYQSCNRGCKETDLIIGSFARKKVNEMSDLELKEFESILQLPDADIYDWYTGKKKPPKELLSPLMIQILEFNPTSV